MQGKNNEKAQKLIAAFGKIIKKHRKEQNKTMYRISAEVAMHKSTWREIEYGLKDFRFTTFWRIAEGIDISPAKLVEELQKELGEQFSLSDLE